MKRRQVLASALSLGTLPLLNWPTWATENLPTPTKDRYFIFCYFGGGWDLMLSLDPRDPEEYTAERMVTTLTDPGYSRLPGGYRDIVESAVPDLTFGPYIGDVVRHADKMSVVRSISMETLTHLSGHLRFNTGRAPIGNANNGSSLATLITAMYGAQEALPNLSLGELTFNEDMIAGATGIRVAGKEDLFRVLTPASNNMELLASADDQIAQFIREQTETSSSKLLMQALASQQGTRDLLAQELAAEFDFYSSNAEMQELLDLFEFNPYVYNDAQKGAIAVKAITSGLSRCVSMTFDGNLDTHYGTDWSQNQGPRQQSGFNAIAKMVDYLENKPFNETESWLDRTTILAYSEFGRTALFNGFGGRDHALTNACMMIGGSIARGKLIGGSSEVGMGTEPVNLISGDVDQTNGSVIKPENIHRAILEDIGDTDDFFRFRAEPLSALIG